MKGSDRCPAHNNSVNAEKVIKWRVVRRGSEGENITKGVEKWKNARGAKGFYCL